jgi:hypothetical protein
MSYDVYLTDPVTQVTLEASEAHHEAGGTYALGGTTELWMNVTYNYAPFFGDTLGDGGLRSLDGQSVAESLSRLEAAVVALGTEPPSSNYWDATQGNARRALEGLIRLAKLAPSDAVWRVS